MANLRLFPVPLARYVITDKGGVRYVGRVDLCDYRRFGYLGQAIIAVTGGADRDLFLDALGEKGMGCEPQKTGGERDGAKLDHVSLILRSRETGRTEALRIRSSHSIKLRS